MPGADIRCERQIVPRLISRSQVNGRKSSCLRPNRAWWRSFGDRRANAFPAFFCPALTFPHASYVLLTAKYNLHYGGARLSCAIADGSTQAWRTPPNPSLKTGGFMADSLLSRSPIRCPCDTDQVSPPVAVGRCDSCGFGQKIHKPWQPRRASFRHF